LYQHEFLLLARSLPDYVLQAGIAPRAIGAMRYESEVEVVDII